MEEISVRVTRDEIISLPHIEASEGYILAALKGAGIPVKGFFLFGGLLRGTLEKEDIPYTGDVIFTWRYEDVGLKDRLVCTECLIDDGFFVVGGSWTPDVCPQCGGVDCRWYEDLTYEEKLKATEIYKRMWREKHNLKENGEYKEDEQTN